MVYVVNELCEIDDVYINCHGVYMTEKEAYAKAMEVYEQAKEDINNNECCEEDMQVWNSCYKISVMVSEAEFDVEYLKEKASKKRAITLPL